MREITTEYDWSACSRPTNLAHVVRDRLDPQRFRWLAADWSGRVRHLLDPDDQAWSDAFVVWATGTGPHPAAVCRRPEFYPLDHRPMAEEVAKLHARALHDHDIVWAAVTAGSAAAEDYPGIPPPPTADADALRQAWWEARGGYRVRVEREFCDQFRDVAGKPFRAILFEPSWRTEAAVALAAGVHAEAAFDRLPVLADALEDAGCADAEILTHCRDGGPHVRGCWVVALVLGSG